MKSNLTKIVSILDYIFPQMVFKTLAITSRWDEKLKPLVSWWLKSVFPHFRRVAFFFIWVTETQGDIFLCSDGLLLSLWFWFYNLNILSKKYLSFSKIFPHTNTLTTTYLRKKKLSTENVAFPIASNVNRWSNWKNNTKLPAIKESPLMINESELSL